MQPNPDVFPKLTPQPGKMGQPGFLKLQTLRAAYRDTLTNHTGGG